MPNQTPNSGKEKKNVLLDNYKKVRLEIFGKIALLTLFVIAIAALLGYLLDQVFNTYPKILIISVIVSYPINRIILKKTFKKFAGNKLEKLKK